MSDIVERLRGRYPVGEGSPPEFGYRQFPVEPIKVEAADEIESLRSRLAEAEALLTLARNNGIDGAMGREIDAFLSREQHG